MRKKDLLIVFLVWFVSTLSMCVAQDYDKESIKQSGEISAAYENAPGYEVVYDKEINLNANEKAKLILYNGHGDEEAPELKAMIKICFGIGQKREFKFVDDQSVFKKVEYRGWPVYYWGVTDFYDNSGVLADLKTVNIIDTDGNGENEIYVYGVSSHGGPGNVGKVFSFEKNGNKIIEKYPAMAGDGNYEFYYYRPDKIFIIAQCIWRSGEARYGGEHYYEFFIDDPADGCSNRHTIGVSRRKINDEDEFKVVPQCIEDILQKYALYKNGVMDKKEQNEARKFVINYWKEISRGDIGGFSKHLVDKVFYYSGMFSASDIIKDKERMLNKRTGIKFELNDFLIYRVKDKTVLEYDKEYTSNKGNDYGKVRSVMELTGTTGNYKISTEKDMVIYNLSSDLN